MCIYSILYVCIVFHRATCNIKIVYCEINIGSAYVALYIVYY